MDNISQTEFGILKILWQHKRLSSREIHDKTSDATGWAYSTTRTIIDRMANKGILSKNKFHGINLYSPEISRVKCMAMQVRSFASKVLETDPVSVLPLFAKSDVLTPEEIDELKVVLKSMEKEE